MPNPGVAHIPLHVDHGSLVRVHSDISRATTLFSFRIVPFRFLCQHSHQQFEAYLSSYLIWHVLSEMSIVVTTYFSFFPAISERNRNLDLPVSPLFGWYRTFGMDSTYMKNSPKNFEKNFEKVLTGRRYWNRISILTWADSVLVHKKGLG